jgi:hypothetical protein
MPDLFRIGCNAMQRNGIVTATSPDPSPPQFGALQLRFGFGRLDGTYRFVR